MRVLIVAIILAINCWNVIAAQRGLKLQAQDAIVSFGGNSDVKLYRGKGKDNKGALYIDAPGGIFSKSLKSLIKAEIAVHMQGLHGRLICDDGWKGKHCDEDVNECLKSNGGCDSKRKCMNTAGSMKCGNCPAGYANDGAKGCKDVNECLKSNGGCDSKRKCMNMPGFVKCGDCPAGYANDGAKGCKDVNECLKSNGGCDSKRKCMNTAGSMKCGNCPSGYVNDGAKGCKVAPKPTKIIAGMITEGYNIAKLPTTWNFNNGPKGKANTRLFDGKKFSAPVGGDSRQQHDELCVVQLNGVCPKGAYFRVHGKDNQVASTHLRHIRTAYSSNGNNWKCYTKGECCGMTSASTSCNAGSQHGHDGMTFTVPGPVQYFMIGTWGLTEIWEIDFVGCVSDGPPKPTKIIAGMITEGYNIAKLPTTWNFINGPKGKANTRLFDGKKFSAPVGGDNRQQHDELCVVQLNGVCPKGAKFKVHGKDNQVASTHLRHIRTAYSSNGNNWKCYTKGNCCGMTSASTSCNAGSQHGNNGMTFTVPGPAKYFMIGTWGLTEIWEIEFVGCV